MSYNTYNSDLHEEVRQWIINNLNVIDDDSNCIPFGGKQWGGFDGKTHTSETKKLMSEVRRGVPKSEETKKRMCIAFKDRKLPPQTEEQKRKNSEAHKGEKNHFYGKTHTEESKRKMSETTSKMQNGKKRGPYKKRNTI
tara:strand:- start:358 stop:774 length:417 start_codon:yes stop_codon:yes gene_type:complete